MEYRVDVLKNKLPSILHDIYWNNPVTSCSKCSLCGNVNNDKKDEPWFKFFCYQLVKNLELSAELNSTNNKEEGERRCKSLIYWMYDRVERFYGNNVVKNKSKFITALHDVWEKFFEDNEGTYKSYRCSVPQASEFKNLTEIKKRKTMFDYCWNYNELKGILKLPSFPNCHIFYDYLKDSLSKYNEISKGCNEDNFIMKNCLRFCTKADPDDILNSSQCRSIEISPDKKEYIKQQDCDALIKEVVPEVKYETKEVEIPVFTFSDNRAIILILFSLWGMFLTLFLLYKITPFRSWIRNKLEKKKIIRDSFNDQSDHESLDADYESVDTDMLNSGYNITYNSDWNSLH
ncbi:PIR Superfamily Protein [Plasmodium ovale wallikeri]|uniref:PIR Superfamily Protein n=1 Tax=Plasmodium ovale wallikeri TaxID=864142 RepID=A0A1A9AKK7_PLAOA|nr:PIR Superfamily Protein [Plasmodium ovale wallikeri]